MVEEGAEMQWKEEREVRLLFSEAIFWIIIMSLATHVKQLSPLVVVEST